MKLLLFSIVFFYSVDLMSQTYSQGVTVTAADCWEEIYFIDQPVAEQSPTLDACSDWFGYGNATASTGVSGSSAFGTGWAFDACTGEDVSAIQNFDGGNLLQKFEYVGDETPEIEEIIDMSGFGHSHAKSGVSAAVSAGAVEYISTTIPNAVGIIDCGSESVTSLVGNLTLSLRYGNIGGSISIPINVVLGTTPIDVLLNMLFVGHGHQSVWERKQHTQAGIYISSNGGFLTPGEAETHFALGVGGSVSLGEIQ